MIHILWFNIVILNDNMKDISFEKIISIENLLLAWKEFLHGKSRKKDVQDFQLHFMDNIFSLHSDLKDKTYIHGGYQVFNISDPKPRNIHKASVRDRLFHHAIYIILYPHFDEIFIHDSYSCSLGKGAHRAIKRFKSFANKVSKNNTKTCWINYYSSIFSNPSFYNVWNNLLVDL